MFMASIRNIAGDCKKTHRWAKVNLTGDDSNRAKPEKLSQRRVIGVGKTHVRLMGNDGTIVRVEPVDVVAVW